MGDKVYWKCREHCELGCRGRAITRGPRATVMRGHCHPPDEEGLEARRRRQKLPGPALPEGFGVPEGPRGRVEEPLEGVGPWLCPEEPEPTPGLVLSKPAAEEDEGLRALSLLSLPPKKRPTLGIGECPGPGLHSGASGNPWVLTCAQMETWGPIWFVMRSKSTWLKDRNLSQKSSSPGDRTSALEPGGSSPSGTF